MTKHETIDAFFKDIKSFTEQMSNADSLLVKHKQKIEKLLEDYSQSIHSNKGGLLEKNDNLKAFIETANKSQQSFHDSFRKTLESQEFRNIFNDSFILLIYGKVSSGKSFFINLLARFMRTFMPGEHLTVFKYELKNGEPKLINLKTDLAVDALECTSEIQGIKIKGLTIVDTPGIASLTPENGALAKKYLTSADYIIHPESSDAPGDKTALNACREISGLGKNFSVLITKSDTKEEDEVNGEIVKLLKNKTESNRQEQESYVIGELRAIGLQAENILSISALCANESFENQQAPQFIESNIPLFFETLKEVLKKGRDIKAQQPLKDIKAFVEKEISAELSKLEKDQKDCSSALKECELDNIRNNKR